MFWIEGVRLVGGCVPWEGTVQLYVNGMWGTICSNEFDNNAARVICRMAGLSDRYVTLRRVSSSMKYLLL